MSSRPLIDGLLKLLNRILNFCTIGCAFAEVAATLMLNEMEEPSYQRVVFVSISEMRLKLRPRKGALEVLFAILGSIPPSHSKGGCNDAPLAKTELSLAY